MFDNAALQFIQACQPTPVARNGHATRLASAPGHSLLWVEGGGPFIKLLLPRPVAPPFHLGDLPLWLGGCRARVDRSGVPGHARDMPSHARLSHRQPRFRNRGLKRRRAAPHQSVELCPRHRLHALSAVVSIELPCPDHEPTWGDYVLTPWRLIPRTSEPPAPLSVSSMR